MNRAELNELARLLKELGEEIEPDKEPGTDRADGGDAIRDFYLPRAPKNFYCDPQVFRKLLGIK